MEVQIISKEIIKPSVSTPHHLRTYKLSFIDQLCPPIYTRIVLFYSPTFENPSWKSVHLKESLSQTLTHFYPLAGRIIKDVGSLDCNDDGATFIEASVASPREMSTVIQQPDFHDQLQKLLPCDPYQNVSPELSTTAHVLLAIQVNHFACGGVAIGVCISHRVADASSLGTFLNSWAAVGRGANITDGVMLGCASSLFPPHASAMKRSASKEDQIRNSAMIMFVSDGHKIAAMKRFVFDGHKITALRGKIGNIGPNLDPPTRFEAVSTLILGAATAATGGEIESMKINRASIVLDIRKRLNPPLAQQSFGNIVHGTVVNWKECENVMDYNCLAAKIRDSIKSINTERLGNIHEEMKEYFEREIILRRYFI